MGVARAKSLYGPWRRYKHNPVLRSDARWKCPGHGSVLQTPSGHWWMLYHGYHRSEPERGRQMLLDLIHWSRKGWPVIRPGSHSVSS
jgi:beta-xylosidase